MSKHESQYESSGHASQAETKAAETKAAKVAERRVVRQDTLKQTRAFICDVPGESGMPALEIHAVDEPEAKRLYSLAFGGVQMDTQKYTIKVAELATLDLLETTDSIQASLLSPAATSNPTFEATVVDAAGKESKVTGTLSGAKPVNVIAQPVDGASKVMAVKLTNPDTAPVDLTVSKVSDGLSSVLYRGRLEPGQSVSFDSAGWVAGVAPAPKVHPKA